MWFSNYTAIYIKTSKVTLSIYKLQYTALMWHVCGSAGTIVCKDTGESSIAALHLSITPQSSLSNKYCSKISTSTQLLQYDSGADRCGKKIFSSITRFKCSFVWQSCSTVEWSGGDIGPSWPVMWCYSTMRVPRRCAHPGTLCLDQWTFTSIRPQQVPEVKCIIRGGKLKVTELLPHNLQML